MSDKSPDSTEPELTVDPSFEPVDDRENLDKPEEAKVLARVGRPIRRKTAQAPVRKSAPTVKRATKKATDFEDDSRVGPVTFVKQSADELKKVHWPSGEQMRTYFVAVLIFVLFIIAFVGLLDLGLGALLLKLFS